MEVLSITCNLGIICNLLHVSVVLISPRDIIRARQKSFSKDLCAYGNII